MTTLKSYLTQDMTDDPQTYLDYYKEWLDRQPYPLTDVDIYKIEPFRPIYGYPANIITYPYTIPYKDS